MAKRQPRQSEGLVPKGIPVRVRVGAWQDASVRANEAPTSGLLKPPTRAYKEPPRGGVRGSPELTQGIPGCGALTGWIPVVPVDRFGLGAACSKAPPWDALIA